MQEGIRKTSSGSVDKAGCVVVCYDTMVQFGMNGSGVEMLGGGAANRISRRRVARRMPWRCVDHRPSAARPSPVPRNPSLHPPFPRCRRSTNNIDTRTLRSATLGSTLPRRPHRHRVGAYMLVETTPPRKLRARRPPSRVRGCCRLRASSGSRHCSLRVLQLVISEHAASPHAPCAGRCCCGPMCPRPALLHDVPAVDKRVIDVVNTAFTSAPARPAGRA